MMKKAGTRNPVFLLDEVDKMAADFRGDPSAALLEVLDPEQNHAFLDHYLDTEYDLSNIMFISTANVVHTIPAALKDRMEIIRIAGLHAEREALDRAALPDPEADQGARPERRRDLVRGCRRDRGGRAVHAGSGVRNLEREIASLCRKIARKVVAKEAEKPILLTPAKVVEMLGVPHYHPAREMEREPAVGVATGSRVDRGRRRDPQPRGDADARPRQDHADGPARET